MQSADSGAGQVNLGFDASLADNNGLGAGKEKEIEIPLTEVKSKPLMVEEGTGTDDSRVKEDATETEIKAVVEEGTETEKTAAAIEEDEEESLRGNWTHHIEFILSCVGYAVGLGNVWRFPYQCYRNGGGCFLIVYWILSACVGFPLVFFEQAIGQYTSQGPMNCWGFSPIIRGIGFSMVALSALGCELKRAACWNNASSLNYLEEVRGTDGLCYNASYLSLPLDTMIDAKSYFTKHFNYTLCPNATTSSSNSRDSSSMCIQFLSPDSATIYRNLSTVLGFWNEEMATANDVSPRLSTDEYFHHYVLRMYDEDNTENIGTPSWGLTLSLLLAWILVFLCLMNGIKTSGKVVYFTALFPYLILFVLIGRGVSLPGAMDGIMFYLTPDFEKIKQPEVWFAAANQLFFSLSCAWGGMIALSSYNKFQNNVLRDALITVFADSFTSFIAGFAVFSIIGYGSLLLGKPVDKVASAGTGLAFVMYPKILLELPGSVAWSIAFFFMLLLLGLDSEFNTMETVLTACLDQMPYFRVNLLRKALFLAGMCALFFLLGIPMVCNGGSYLSDVVDEYSSGWGALIVGVIEALSISWLYGSKKFHEDLRLMMGTTWTKAGLYYIFGFLGIIAPGVIILILLYSWVIYTPMSSNRTDEIIGWLCAAFVLVWPPLLAVYEIVTAKCGGSFLQRLRYACSPTNDWGPWYVKHRRLVTHLGPNFDGDPRKKFKKAEVNVEAVVVVDGKQVAEIKQVPSYNEANSKKET